MVFIGVPSSQSGDDVRGPGPARGGLSGDGRGRAFRFGADGGGGGAGARPRIGAFASSIMMAMGC